MMKIKLGNIYDVDFKPLFRREKRYPRLPYPKSSLWLLKVKPRWVRNRLEKLLYVDVQLVTSTKPDDYVIHPSGAVFDMRPPGVTEPDRTASPFKRKVDDEEPMTFDDETPTKPQDKATYGSVTPEDGHLNRQWSRDGWTKPSTFDGLRFGCFLTPPVHGPTDDEPDEEPETERPQMPDFKGFSASWSVQLSPEDAEKLRQWIDNLRGAHIPADELYQQYLDEVDPNVIDYQSWRWTIANLPRFDPMSKYYNPAFSEMPHVVANGDILNVSFERYSLQEYILNAYETLKRVRRRDGSIMAGDLLGHPKRIYEFDPDRDDNVGYDC